MKVLDGGFFGLTCVDDEAEVVLKGVGFGGSDGDALQEKVLNLVKFDEHENLLKYLGCRSVEGEIWLVKEKQELWSTSLLSTKLSEPALASVAKQVLDGLDWLHANGITHGDLHASNVLVDINGTVKLTDYGIADELRSGKSEDSVNAHPPWWTAPELLGAGVDGKSSIAADLWALGATLIELADGQAPYSDHHPDRPRPENPQTDGAPETKGCPQLKTAPNWSTFMNEFIACCSAELPSNRSSLKKLQNHRFLEQANAEALVARLLELGESARYHQIEIDPFDQLEKLYRTNQTLRIPFVSLDSFAPEVFAQELTDESRLDDSSRERPALSMIPALTSAFEYHEEKASLMPDAKDHYESRAEELSSVLRNLYRN
ncbi:hypothetical protein NDN08_006192 [Rhodosorus marinus]|uniref:Protein kinase domain-containing protein n=1 Tax=Rhodosorus marinus TaxID=101924 RepID=A0AAV8UNY8_9RHOD|nr:hypothetical protein NDN08_006192 [Rhodosorus marinus]